MRWELISVRKATLWPSAIQRADTALGAFFRRLKARQGSPKAITATARKLAVAIYNMLKYGQEYVERGAAYYESEYQNRVIQGLTREPLTSASNSLPKNQLRQLQCSYWKFRS